jgi:tellurite resistance-related uncharacterized protein
VKSIPAELKPSDRTDTFTETTIPRGLLKDHRTRAGVWGKITLTRGRLLYIIQEDVSAQRAEERVELSPEFAGIVEPQVYHRVEPMGEVEFYVEFYE